MPRPQLKLVFPDLSGERINPPTPAVLGFLLDAPSKKIVAFGVPCHHLRKSLVVRRKRQVGSFIGLLIESFLSPGTQGPSQTETSANSVKAKTGLFVISKKRAFTLVAISTDFGIL